MSTDSQLDLQPSLTAIASSCLRHAYLEHSISSSGCSTTRLRLHKQICYVLVKFLLPHKTALFVGKHQSRECSELSTADGYWGMIDCLQNLALGQEVLWVVLQPGIEYKT